MKEMIKEIKEENEFEKSLKEEQLKYKYAALVMNRFFFVGTILYFVIAFCSAILSIPNFYKFN